MKACPKCGERYSADREQCFVDGSTLEALPDARLGTTIAGRYVLEATIGIGGMATVYRARHKVDVGQRFAIKVLNPLLARDPVLRERFRREAKSAKKIAHANIIEIFEEGDTGDGTAYIVMEHLEGQSLADIVHEAPVPLERSIGLMIQMTRGIARAHDLGVIHRDLKPENIFVCRPRSAAAAFDPSITDLARAVAPAPDADDDADESVTSLTGPPAAAIRPSDLAGERELVKVLDFGIALSKHDARLTGSGELLGTPEYMAPERIKTNDAALPADLYALGVLFFEMLTGRVPFDAPDAASILVRHLKDPPPPVRSLQAGVPESLANLVERLLAKDPKERPADAHKVIIELIDVARETGAPVPPELERVVEAAVTADLLPRSDKGTRRWIRRADVFREMLERAYGANRWSDDVRGRMGRIDELANLVAELKRQSVTEQSKLEDIVQRGRETRRRLGQEVDALGAEASRVREALRASQEQLAASTKRQETARQRLVEVHKSITYWEGRSGFMEPHEGLRDAYQDGADVVQGWLTAKRAQREVESAVQRHEEVLAELESKLATLRDAVTTHDLDTQAEGEAVHGVIAQTARQLDVLEEELVSLATSLMEPLRPHRQLAPLFARLETI